MTDFLKIPNLPQGEIKLAVCGELCRELKDFMRLRDISLIECQANNLIDPAVKFHADMAAIHITSQKILVDKNQLQLGKALETEGFDVYYTKTPVAGEYPDDIGLNFIILPGRLIGRLSFADKRLPELTENLRSINVRQGYCKCSVLIISENALITDDESIYRAAAKNGIDCLLVSKGDVLLPGHGYGFIGGASAKISGTEVLFFGDITKHRDYEKIAAFIMKHGCKIISLPFPLTDFGGLIPLKEKTP